MCVYLYLSSAFISSQEESRSRMLKVLGHGDGESVEETMCSLDLSEQGSFHKRRATQAAPSSDARFKPPTLPSPTNHTWNVLVTYVSLYMMKCLPSTLAYAILYSDYANHCTTLPLHCTTNTMS